MERSKEKGKSVVQYDGAFPEKRVAKDSNPDIIKILCKLGEYHLR